MKSMTLGSGCLVFHHNFRLQSAVLRLSMCRNYLNLSNFQLILKKSFFTQQKNWKGSVFEVGKSVYRSVKVEFSFGGTFPPH